VILAAIDFEKIIKHFGEEYSVGSIFECDTFQTFLYRNYGEDVALKSYEILRVLEDLGIIEHIGFDGPIDVPDMFVIFRVERDLCVET
jgi:hypothetical protein